MKLVASHDDRPCCNSLESVLLEEVSRSQIVEKFPVLWILNSHGRVHKSLPLGRILSQILFYSIASYLLNISVIIIFPSCLGLASGPFLGFPTKSLYTFLCFFSLPYPPFHSL